MPFTRYIHIVTLEATKLSSACQLVMDFGRSYKDDSTGRSISIAFGNTTKNKALAMRLVNIGLATMLYIN